jgi:VanZ family protein
METRRSSRRLLVFAFVIAAIALMGLLAPMPRAWHNRLGTSVADMMHVPAFAILTSLALAIVNRFLSQRFAVHLFVTGVVIAAGAAVEVAQSVLGRSASIHDLIANSAGAIAALLIRVSLGSDTIFKRFCRVVAVCLLLVASAGPCLSILDDLNQRKTPDALGAFATRTEFERWFSYHAKPRRVANPFGDAKYTGDVRRSANAAHITLYPGYYPMFQLQHLTADWSR